MRYLLVPIVFTLLLAASNGFCQQNNSKPKITGQSALSVNQGGSLTIEFSHLQVTDSDNSYPAGFTLKIYAGKDFTFAGNTAF